MVSSAVDLTHPSAAEEGDSSRREASAAKERDRARITELEREVSRLKLDLEEAAGRLGAEKTATEETLR